MKLISSRTNPVVKHIVELSSSARERAACQLFVAEGVRTCTTLVQAGMQVQQLFVTPPLVPQATQLAAEHLLTEVTDEVMAKISSATTPSGMLGVFHIPEQPAKIENAGVVLAQVREPGNVGTLIRSCAAFGMRTVVLVESADVWNPKVIQASAGTLGSVDIFVISWEELLARKGNYKLCALTPTNGKAPSELDLKNSLLVIGNEAHGISAAWLNKCEQRMTLAMPGDAEGLNAAVAGSIGVYEMSRTRKQ